MANGLAAVPRCRPPRINIASGDASNSACASTSASLGGTTATGTGHSVLAPKRSASNALVPHEVTTVTGGEDGTKEVDINELEVYMKEKPICWVDPTGEGAQFDILSWWKSNQTDA
ncbi:hypothetical protein E2562_008285 [Oryza meyeriana var. granulata]|uniref:Uncharacterized protein n=1 Tax=Oryza meyeriana var. granulata TaxID=110450 RepID=A0A6G1DGT5_9ORYZ|nr:hypothetical protein E2562_008285 [Oryza meyeriana var. granulata]